MDLYVDGQNVERLEDVVYLMVSVQRNVWGTKLKKCYVDVGHTIKSDSVITDERGKEIDFQSEVDVMNYLYHTGWLHKESLYIMNANGQKFYTMTFMRKGA